MKRNIFLCLGLALVMALTVMTPFAATAADNNTELILGDANLDFKVNVKDATNVQKSVAKLDVFGNLATEAADVDENKTINVKDATNIQKYSAQYSTPYNVGKNFEFKAEIAPEISLSDATEIALEYAGVNAADAIFDDKDFEVKGGVAYFEVEFSANGYEYEVAVNAENGKVIYCEKEADDDYRKPAEKPADSDLISKETAEATALSHAGVAASEARFEKTELDKDNGKFVYEVEFEANGFEYNYEIDATNGNILDSEKDRADD